MYKPLYDINGVLVQPGDVIDTYGRFGNKLHTGIYVPTDSDVAITYYKPSHGVVYNDLDEYVITRGKPKPQLKQVQPDEHGLAKFFIGLCITLPCLIFEGGVVLAIFLNWLVFKYVLK